MTVELRQGDLSAIFDPEHGMNLLSYRKGALEVIDQSTKPLFEQRYAGLGALIGPHFHFRPPSRIRPIANQEAFPHLKLVEGRPDPFSHGIGRYVPWKYEKTNTLIKGQLAGNDLFQGMKLSDLEGQNFTMTFEAELKEEGLQVELTVVSDTDSVVGFHYYYRLPQNKGMIISDIQLQFLEKSTLVPVRSDWLKRGNTLELPLNEALDINFHPLQPRKGEVLLKTSEYNLSVKYEAPSEELSLQIFHPLNASYVCIEPLSCYNPKNPHLTTSRVKALIRIDPLGEAHST